MTGVCVVMDADTHPTIDAAGRRSGDLLPARCGTLQAFQSRNELGSRPESVQLHRRRHCPAHRR